MQGERPSPRTLARAAVALAIAATTGCTGFHGFTYRGTTAASFLRTIEESKDPNARYLAYDSLSSPRCFDDEGQKDRAARTLIGKLKGGREPDATRAVICRTLGQLRRPEARDAVLARVMTVDVAAECRVAAIESLGELKAKDRRINQYLVAGMEHEEPAIRVASMQALKAITGTDLGVDALAWKKYVEALPDAGPAAPPKTPPAPLPPLPASPAPPDDGIR